MNWSEFFAMGGYAFYVWSAYALATVVLVMNIAGARSRRRHIDRALTAFYRARKEGK